MSWDSEWESIWRYMLDSEAPSLFLWQVFPNPTDKVETDDVVRCDFLDHLGGDEGIFRDV